MDIINLLLPPEFMIRSSISPGILATMSFIAVPKGCKLPEGMKVAEEIFRSSYPNVPDDYNIVIVDTTKIPFGSIKDAIEKENQ